MKPLFQKNLIKEKIESKLGVKFSKNRSHHLSGLIKIDGIIVCKIKVPKGRDYISPGVQEDIFTRMRINIEQFANLINCPLKREGYIEILREKGFL